MQAHLTQLNALSRAAFVKLGRRLEYFTILYNSLEGRSPLPLASWPGVLPWSALVLTALLKSPPGRRSFGDYALTLMKRKERALRRSR